MSATEQDLKDLVISKELEIKRWRSGYDQLWIALYESGKPTTPEEAVAHVLRTLKQNKKEITDLADENDRLRAQLAATENETVSKQDVPKKRSRKVPKPKGTGGPVIPGVD